MRLPLLGWFLASSIVIAMTLGPSTAPVSARNALESSIQCRRAIAARARALIATSFQVVDACHGRRDKGKFIGDCTTLNEADEKGVFPRTQRKLETVIAAQCGVDDAVRANYPGRDVAGALVDGLGAEVEHSAAIVQGSPDVVSDKAGRACHRALGKARTQIVKESVALSLKCQKAIDASAKRFSELQASCVATPAKAGARGANAIAKACRGIDGAAVASCTPLPACVIESATATGRAMTRAIFPARCGNGLLESDEECDDGNAIDGDGCDRNCTPTGCGNGVVAGGEACDDGELVDGDGCDADCTETACGNGIVTAGESCDDRNLVDGDGCDRNCTPTGCGNGIVTAGEECEDGNAVDGDGCNACRANDRCETATVVASTTFGDVLDVAGATTSLSDAVQSCLPAGAGSDRRSVWYRFTPPRDGIVTVDTFGSDYDTALTAYTGACGSLTEFACSDDSEEDPGVAVAHSQLAFAATAGTPLLFQVTQVAGAGDASTLQLSFSFVGEARVVGEFLTYCFFSECSFCFRNFCDQGIYAPKAVNGELLFVANDETSGFELWRSDGTPEGTAVVRDIFPGQQWGCCDESFPPPPFCAVRPFEGPCASLDATSDGSRYLFNATDGQTRTGRWQSDGTRNGTSFIGPPAVSSTTFGIAESTTTIAERTAVSGGPALVARDDPAKVANGAQAFIALGISGPPSLWRRSRGGDDAVLLRSAESLAGLPVGPTTVVNGSAFFLVCPPCMLIPGCTSFGPADQFSGCNGACDLWKTDGTPGGTARVGVTGIVVPFMFFTPTEPGPPFTGIFEMIAVNHTLFIVPTSPYVGPFSPQPAGPTILQAVLP